MPRWKKIPTGTWFAVPVGKNTYGLGIIARQDGSGGIFCYFFGPRRRRVPTLKDTAGLTPADAVLLARVGDLGLQEGTWLIIGSHQNWNPADWPLPAFGRIDDDRLPNSAAWRAVYSDDLEWISDKRCTLAEAKKLPEDCLCGSESLEYALGKKLQPRSPKRAGAKKRA